MSTVKASYRELRAEYLNHKHRGTQMPPERLDALVETCGTLLDHMNVNGVHQYMFKNDGSARPHEQVRQVVRGNHQLHFILG